MDWGSVPQWVTAIIAGGALVTGILSISNQRDIARKRAATDFFLKTEMDHENLESHKKYSAALDRLKMLTKENGDLDTSFIGSDEYWAIRDYLNLHELMAVGVLKNVFDGRVCHDFWAGELHRAYVRAMPVIRYVQSKAGQEGTYIEMVKVAKDWENKRKRGIY